MSVALQNQRTKVREERTRVQIPLPIPTALPTTTPIPNISKPARRSRISQREARMVKLAKAGLFLGSLTLALAAGIVYLNIPIRIQTEQTRKIALTKQERSLKEQLRMLQIRRNSLLDPGTMEANAQKSQMGLLDTRHSVTLK